MHREVTTRAAFIMIAAVVAVALLALWNSGGQFLMSKVSPPSPGACFYGDGMCVGGVASSADCMERAYDAEGIDVDNRGNPVLLPKYRYLPGTSCPTAPTKLITDGTAYNNPECSREFLEAREKECIASLSVSIANNGNDGDEPLCDDGELPAVYTSPQISGSGQHMDTDWCYVTCDALVTCIPYASITPTPEPDQSAGPNQSATPAPPEQSGHPGGSETPTP